MSGFASTRCRSSKGIENQRICRLCKIRAQRLSAFFFPSRINIKYIGNIDPCSHQLSHTLSEHDMSIWCCSVSCLSRQIGDSSFRRALRLRHAGVGDSGLLQSIQPLLSGTKQLVSLAAYDPLSCSPAKALSEPSAAMIELCSWYRAEVFLD